ncbi:hypothetical protein ABPG74_006664, partial [Tetrahymena malaccensis]
MLKNKKYFENIQDILDQSLVTVTDIEIDISDIQIVEQAALDLCSTLLNSSNLSNLVLYFIKIQICNKDFYHIAQALGKCPALSNIKLILT